MDHGRMPIRAGVWHFAEREFVDKAAHLFIGDLGVCGDGVAAGRLGDMDCALPVRHCGVAQVVDYVAHHLSNILIVERCWNR